MHVQAFQSSSRNRLILLLPLFVVLALSACSSTESPVPMPGRIALFSGDGQYTKKGTELQDPVVVRVTLSDGSSAPGTLVRFQIAEGGGSLSRSSATTGSDGKTSVRWTMGPATGTGRLKIFVAEDSKLAVQAQATSSDYYCPEEDPTFVRKFTPNHNVFLFTKQSALLASTGARAGLVQINFDFPNAKFQGTPFIAFDENILINIVRDCAFSPNGDFYIAWTQGAAVHEILKIHPDKTVSHFATLDSYFGTEIETLPSGVVAGCDEFGPFTVGCRDTLTRYEDALFIGDGTDAANNDALAVDPTTGDLYFIYLGDRTLRRLRVDGYTETLPAETVTTLAADEANGARGMVVAGDGSVYILVESSGTKSIVKVTSAGVESTAIDFFTARGAGNAAGIQSDLAIDRTLGSGFIYTLDTLNNVLLVYQVSNGQLTEITSFGGANDASDGGSGERVGLAVFP